MKPLTLLDEKETLGCCQVCDEPGLGALRTARGNLPLKLVDVEAHVVGLFVETTLRQTYVNTLGVPIEATYVFPLPDRAAVTRFRFEVGERLVEGELQERGQARQTYDRAVRAGHRAAITEEERPGVFTMRVGNLMPGDEATVWVTIVGPLPFADGEATYQLPLVVAPRYIPGSGLGGEQAGDGVAHDTDAVPDASRISPPVLLPGFPSPVRLSIRVDIDPAGMTLGAVRSSLHAVSTTARDGRVTVRLAPGDRLDRDFILRVALGGAALQPSLTLCPDDRETGTSTFCLTIVPPLEASRARRPKDVVLLLDRSGSMEGWKMIAARRATARMIDTLTPLDRFAVYAFDDKIETASGLGGRDLVSASDRNRFKAVEFLAKLGARGGTEMAQPLQLAARNLLQASSAGEVRDKVVVLVTDGQVGNEDQLLRSLGADLGRLRVFTLGIDQSVNAAFLRRLASLGGGSCELVESEDRLDDVMDKVHRRIDTPVLTDLHLQAEGLEVLLDTIVPARIPDLFPGTPLTIFGRCKHSAGTLSLRAVDGSGMAWGETLAPRTTTGTRAITAAWARGQLRQLEDRYLVAGGHEQAGLERELVDTSLRHGVLCRFTAFVAVDRAEVVNRGGNAHRVNQAVEKPAGWDEQQSTGSRRPGGFLDDLFGDDDMRAAPRVSGGFPAPAAAPAPSNDPFTDPFAAPFGGALPLGGSGGSFGAPFGGAPLGGAPFGGDPFGEPPGGAFGGPVAGGALPLGAGFDEAESLGAPSPRQSAPASGSFESLDLLDEGAAPPSPPPPPPSRASASKSPPITGAFNRGHASPPPGAAPMRRSGKAEAKPESAGGESFDGYRRRAEDLVTILAGRLSTAIERQRELGRLIVLLERLLDDLRSVGAPAHLVRPLDDLVRDLAVIRKYAAGQLDDREVERLWQRAADVLREYVKGGGPPTGPTIQPPKSPPSGGRREFWK